MNLPRPSLRSAARGLIAAAAMLPGAVQKLGAEQEAVLARSTLREALARENGFVKVHAAEVLTAYGDRDRVRAVFLQQAENHAEELRYRHGIWRTLALSAENSSQRAAWLERIEKVVLDPSSPDRLHAVESLAKLGGPHSAAVLAATRQWYNHAPEEETPMLEWVLWQAGEHEVETALRHRLASPTLVSRLRAAYVLRQIRTMDPSTLAALSAAADAEPVDSAARPIIIASAFLLRASPERLPAWRSILEEMAAQGPPSAAYDALQGLMGVYHTADLARILPLLQHAHGDVRIAAAWTILDVTSRNPAAH